MTVHLYRNANQFTRRFRAAEKYREKFDPSSQAPGIGMSGAAATPLALRRPSKVTEGERPSSSARAGDASFGGASAARLDRVDSVIPLDELDSIWDKAAETEVLWAGDEVSHQCST